LSTTADDGWSGPVETAILFVDLVSTSEFASVLGLQAYSNYIDSFEDVCMRQCRHFFEVLHRSTYTHGQHYDFNFLGDQLIVYAHSGQAANDVYQLLCLAIALKCGWLGTALNRERIESGVGAAEIASGVNVGTVWTTRRDGICSRRGFAINAAKRIETLSREGEHFRIFVGDAAFKRVNRRVRHILFAPRRIAPMKGLVTPVGTREVIDSFIDPTKRLEPELCEGFLSVAERAIRSSSFDLWIHSCLQVALENRAAKVSDASLELCRQVLNIEVDNACALYYAAQAMLERRDPESALLYLQDLTRAWPNFADGWLELGRLQKRRGDLASARDAILQARRHGVGREEEELPELG
jgi:class 3 adenylate cyclase